MIRRPAAPVFARLTDCIRPPLRVRPLAAALAVALAAACTGDGTGPGGRPGIHLRSELPASDTITAPLPRLELQVLDAEGEPAAGVAVELRSEPAPNTCYPLCPLIPTLVLVGPQGYWETFLSLTTDAEGIVRANALLGPVAGPAGLLVRVPALGYEDTVRVTVKPGASTGLRLSPADTAVQVGRSYTLRTVDVDRYGNETPRGAATLSTFSQDVEIQGQQVTARSFGRAQITATVGGLTTTAHVSVVPTGTVAATRMPVSGGLSTVLMGLDGNGVTVLPNTPNARVAAWSPDGARLLMLHNVLDQPDRIFGYHVGTAATQTLLDVVNHPRVRQAASPRYSPDGQWIWFSGYESPVGNSLLWRMRPDGSGLELVTPQTSIYVNAEDPFPSPDGARLVYSGRRTDADYLTALMVMDVAAGTHTKLVNDGTGEPRWSPTGEWIVYGGSYGRPWLVRPDGSERRELTGVDGWVTEWSPDGRYILTQGQSGWAVVEASTGEVVRLPASITQDLVRAVWRPTP
jgi:hypothetical protein